MILITAFLSYQVDKNAGFSKLLLQFRWEQISIAHKNDTEYFDAIINLEC